jgi:hypothetical protein
MTFSILNDVLKGISLPRVEQIVSCSEPCITYRCFHRGIVEYYKHPYNFMTRCMNKKGGKVTLISQRTTQKTIYTWSELNRFDLRICLSAAGTNFLIDTSLTTVVSARYCSNTVRFTEPIKRTHPLYCTCYYNNSLTRRVTIKTLFLPPSS